MRLRAATFPSRQRKERALYRKTGRNIASSDWELHVPVYLRERKRYSILTVRLLSIPFHRPLQRRVNMQPRVPAKARTCLAAVKLKNVRLVGMRISVCFPMCWGSPNLGEFGNNPFDWNCVLIV